MEKYEIVRFDSKGINLDVRVSPSDDTVWLTQDQMALLFDKNRSVITKHINHIFLNGELDEKTSVQILHQSKNSRPPKVFNLDVILAVGYRVNGKKGILFRKWASSVLKEFLIKGYAINEQRVLVTDDNYVHLVRKVDSIDDRLSKIEKENSRASPDEKLFYEGEFYDAVSFLEDLVRKAGRSIVLIDPYCDKKALDILSSRREGVVIELLFSSKARLSKNETEAFSRQYGNLSCHVSDSFHDRFLVIDAELAYHIGASLNYAGKKAFEVSRINDASIIEGILKETEK